MRSEKPKSSRWGWVLLALSVALTALTGCDPGCTRNSDCRSGLVCGEVSSCVIAPDLADTDGGPTGDLADGGTADDLSQAPDLSDVIDLPDLSVLPDEGEAP